MGQRPNKIAIDEAVADTHVGPSMPILVGVVVLVCLTIFVVAFRLEIRKFLVTTKVSPSVGDTVVMSPKVEEAPPAQAIESIPAETPVITEAANHPKKLVRPAFSATVKDMKEKLKKRVFNLKFVETQWDREKKIIRHSFSSGLSLVDLFEDEGDGQFEDGSDRLLQVAVSFASDLPESDENSRLRFTPSAIVMSLLTANEDQAKVAGKWVKVATAMKAEEHRQLKKIQTFSPESTPLSYVADDFLLDCDLVLSGVYVRFTFTPRGL